MPRANPTTWPSLTATTQRSRRSRGSDGVDRVQRFPTTRRSTADGLNRTRPPGYSPNLLPDPQEASWWPRIGYRPDASRASRAARSLPFTPPPSLRCLVCTPPEGCGGHDLGAQLETCPADNHSPRSRCFQRFPRSHDLRALRAKCSLQHEMKARRGILVGGAGRRAVPRLPQGVEAGPDGGMVRTAPTHAREDCP